MADGGGSALLDFARVLRRRRSVVFTFTLGLPLVTAIVMLFTPNRYTANGTILVETPHGGLGSDLISQITAVTGITAQVSPTEMYLAILRSERTALTVADSLGLSRHYKVKAKTEEERIEKTLRIMQERIVFDPPDPVSITIEAMDLSPTMAASIVNAYLIALERSSETLALSRARRTRIRVENALNETLAKLDSTRVRLEGFQERYGVFSVEKQTEGMLELIGTLQAQLLEAQTERDALGGFASPQSGRLKGLDYQIEAIEGQIAKLVGRLEGQTASSIRSGAVASRGRSEEPFLIPLTEMPRLAGEYAHILIDLKVQETKYSLLAAQLEQTKIEESQSIPAFESLDRARVPHAKSGPHRVGFVLAALVGGLLAGILCGVFLDDLDRRIDGETRGELAAALPSFLRRAFRIGPTRGIAG